MISSPKTVVAGSAAFLLVAAAVGTQQMRIQRLERMLIAVPLSPDLGGYVNVPGMLNTLWSDQRNLSLKLAALEQAAAAGTAPLFERDAIFEAVQNYYFAHRSKRLATRTEFLRPTSSFFLDRFSLPNSLLDTYPTHTISFGTGGDRGSMVPDNESAVFTLSFRKAREEWPPGIHFFQAAGVSVEVRALGLVTPAPEPVTTDCAGEPDPAILALVPYARQYAYGRISDADLCAAMKPYKTIDGGEYGPTTRLFTLQGQTSKGAWLPTVLFAHTTGGFAHTGIRIRANTGNESADPSVDEAEKSAQENSALEQDILADLVKNVHFSGCEYACAY